MIKKKKKKRKYNTNLIKITYSYSIIEIACLFNIHKETVRKWLNQGLSKIDDKKPYLVLGAHLKIFLKDRQSKRKTKCKKNELYCMTCKKAVTAKENIININFYNKKPMVSGRCNECNTKINQTCSLNKISNLINFFVIKKINNKPLLGCEIVTLNTNLKEEKLYD